MFAAQKQKNDIFVCKEFHNDIEDDVEARK